MFDTRIGFNHREPLEANLTMATIWTRTGPYHKVAYKNEADLETAIREVKRDLFGPRRIYLDSKRKIGAKGGLQNIPDGYVIDLSRPRPDLFVVENELASHDTFSHIAAQLLKFSISFHTSRSLIKGILYDGLQADVAALNICNSYARERNFRNLDHLLDDLVQVPFKALVIIDEASEHLGIVLSTHLKFSAELVELGRYENGSGERVYSFEPFLDYLSTEEEVEVVTSGDSPAISDFDTIVVPAREEGFERVFIGENRWYSIRVGGIIRPQIKYIAAYRVHPIQAITHVADVDSIEPWPEDDKYVVNFRGGARAVTPIPLVKNGRIRPLQSIRYTNYDRLKAAANIDEAFP